jgi:hypothetical protein
MNVHSGLGFLAAHVRAADRQWIGEAGCRKLDIQEEPSIIEEQVDY